MNHSLQIPKGTKVTSDGKFYFFEVDFDAIKFMLGEAEQVRLEFKRFTTKVLLLYCYIWTLWFCEGPFNYGLNA